MLMYQSSWLLELHCVCVCVQRSLSNTEDECTHLKEMNERTQEELQELANKYNGAVNEIKDLTDKIKAGHLREGRTVVLVQKFSCV